MYLQFGQLSREQVTWAFIVYLSFLFSIDKHAHQRHRAEAIKASSIKAQWHYDKPCGFEGIIAHFQKRKLWPHKIFFFYYLYVQANFSMLDSVYIIFIEWLHCSACIHAWMHLLLYSYTFAFCHPVWETNFFLLGHQKKVCFPCHFEVICRNRKEINFVQAIYTVQ